MGGVALDDGGSRVKAPDGGWGWVVLFGCFVITGFSYAFPKAISVFFKELIREFDVGYSDTAWISSILLAMLYGTGPVCSVMVNRFGCRPVMMVGGLFASLGMILASFATSIIHIYLCVGVITGLGLALNFQPALIMLNRYFSEKRPLANGLAAAGSPVALCCLSPLGQVLQYQFGWRGGFLILGGILLNCCACGALMRPLTAPKKPAGELAIEEGAAAPAEEEKKPKPKAKLLDFTVFKNPGFVVYAVAATIMVLGLFVPPVFVVSYAKDLKYEDNKSALLLTILGMIDIFARPTCGVIAGLKWVRPHCVYLLGFAVLFNGTTDLLGSMAKDYASLVVFCVFFGISYGMVGALQFEVLMSIVGTEKFPSAIGLVLLMEAMAVLVGPPSAGKLLDATKDYKYVFLLAGTEVVLSALVLTTGNLLFIKKTPQQSDAMLEDGKAGTEMEQLRKPEKEVKELEEGPPKTNGGVEEMKVGAPKPNGDVEEVKEEAPKPNGDVEEVKEEAPKTNGGVEEVKEVSPKPNGDVEEVMEEAPKPNKGVEEVKEVSPKPNGDVGEPRPDSVMVDSGEVELFLKDGGAQNADAVSNPETKL